MGCCFSKKVRVDQTSQDLNFETRTQEKSGRSEGMLSHRSNDSSAIVTHQSSFSQSAASAMTSLNSEQWDGEAEEDTESRSEFNPSFSSSNFGGSSHKSDPKEKKKWFKSKQNNSNHGSVTKDFRLSAISDNLLVEQQNHSSSI